MGERCAAQHSGQDLGAASGAFTIKNLLESELQSEEETAGLCVEVGSIFGICTPLDVCAQSNKGKNEKKISGNSDTLCICRNGFELLTFLPN